MENDFYTYDSLMDDSPAAQRNRARGEVWGTQRTVIKVVEARFPTLTSLAEQHITTISNVETLQRLVQQVATTPDENYLRWLLGTYAA